VTENGFGESALYLIPKLTEGQWGLFNKEQGCYLPVLEQPLLPMSLLQKRWLKTMLEDERISLFLTDIQIQMLSEQLQDIQPLFEQKDFCYYDRYTDGDCYQDALYRENFQKMLTAIHRGEGLRILFECGTGESRSVQVLPCKLEYSVKNDCFRLLALQFRRSKEKLMIIRLSRVKSVELTGMIAGTKPDIDQWINAQYEKEPVRVLIRDSRNAMERVSLKFANYKKKTRKLDEDLYECEIYYNKDNETELLIEILSFGPMLKVLGNEHFIGLIRERLEKQNIFFT